MHTPESLLAFLTAHDIPYRNHHHPAVMTAAATEATTPLPGVTVRNLFLRDKKRTLWLVTVPLLLDQVDLKALRHVLGASGTLSFADAPTLLTHLGVTPGSVTPFAAINDPTHTVRVVLDARILTGPFTNAHPLINTQTTAVTPADLQRFFTLTGHIPQVLQVPTIQP